MMLDSPERRWRGLPRAWPVLQGMPPIERSRVPTEALAGLTLAALGIPAVLGYAKIAGMPLVTGLYTMLLPMAAFAVLGSFRDRGHTRRSAHRSRSGGLGAIRPAGRAGGPADRRDADRGPAGPAQLPSQ